MNFSAGLRGRESDKRRRMTKPKPRETELYAPIKAFLEGQGYVVKSEVGAADVVACRVGEAAADDPVIVELKTGFTLTVLHQAIARQAISDAVYVAIPHATGRVFQANLRANLKLCRRLGLGLITVRLSDGHVTPHLDPGTYKPRQSKSRKARLLREFARRVGDPNTGGATRSGLVTTYRQDALRLVQYLEAHGPTKASEVAKATGVANARRIMADDHYGWFERVETGIYTLTPKGASACDTWRDALAAAE
jgi:hypothetical protein